jgi:hypothetical protein
MMRYKVGWFISRQVLALTHLVPEVTQDDFVGIIDTANVCLAEAKQPFHMIIDNRIIKSAQVVPLEVILQTIPQLQASPLRTIIMVLPHHIRDRAVNMESQRIEDIQLTYVENLAAGFTALQTTDTSLSWDLQTPDFFVDDVSIISAND